MISLIVEAVVRSMALGLILWIALTLTRSRNPHLHKMLWSVVLLASLAIPLIMRAPVAVPVIPAPDYVLTLRTTDGASTQSSPAWSGISVVYVLVSLALLLRYAHSLLQMWRIRRAALVLREDWTAGLDVRVTTRIPGPATFGSTILLPTQFTEWSLQKVQAVLAHERAHVAHLDCYVLWLARLYTCLFWINPLAWWLQRRLATLAETTSDEAAVSALGDRPGYAEILLEFAGQRTLGAVATAMGQSAIARRIDRILAGITPATMPGLAQRLLVLAALLPAIAATAAPLSPPPPAQLTPDAIRTPPGFPGLEKYYPKEAMHRGIEGLVRIQVTVDAKGRATDTLILSEDPLELGFGAAASTLAHVFEYDNAAGRQAQLTFNVKFELKHDEPHSGTTRFEEPDGL
jgi:TonB family protein